MLFGAVCLPEAKAVIIDIDPLAEHPPRDILERSENAAVAAVNQLRAFQTISADQARQSMERLIRRINEREMYIAADRILEMIRDANLMDASTRKEMFEAAVSSCSQIILNAMRNLISRLKAADPQIDVIAPALDLLVASDPSAPNGLSVSATTSLALARQVLAAQMMDDHAHGLLDRDRLALLLGGDPGAAVLGRYVLEPVVRSLGSV